MSIKSVNDLKMRFRKGDIPTQQDFEDVFDSFVHSSQQVTEHDDVTAQLDTKITKNAEIVPNTATKITYDANGLVTGGSTLAAADIPALDWSKIATGKPSTLAGYGINDAPTKAEMNAAVAAVVNTAPATLDTLNELATALGDDPNFAATIATQIGTKVPKNAAIAAGTATKITYDANGLVTAGSTPTTLAGYGILDAVTRLTYPNGQITQGGDTIPLGVSTIQVPHTDTAFPFVGGGMVVNNKNNDKNVLQQFIPTQGSTIYWRKWLPFSPTDFNDTFTGVDGSVPAANKWIRMGLSNAIISGNTLALPAFPGIEQVTIVESLFSLVGDFEITFVTGRKTTNCIFGFSLLPEISRASTTVTTAAHSGIQVHTNLNDIELYNQFSKVGASIPETNNIWKIKRVGSTFTASYKATEEAAWSDVTGACRTDDWYFKIYAKGLGVSAPTIPIYFNDFKILSGNPAPMTADLLGATWSDWKEISNADGVSVTDAMISMSDITTNNVSTTKHGFAPKLPDDPSKYLNGAGEYTTPASGGGSSVGATLYLYTTYGGF